MKKEPICKSLRGKSPEAAAGVTSGGIPNSFRGNPNSFGGNSNIFKRISNVFRKNPKTSSDIPKTSTGISSSSEKIPDRLRPSHKLPASHISRISHISRTSHVSRTSHISHTSHTLRTSHISHISHASRTSRISHTRTSHNSITTSSSRSETLPAALPNAVVWLLAITAGLSVANVYYAQPLLDAMAHSFHVPQASIGIVITMTQLGYGAGLLLLVPLGDLVDARKLIMLQLLLLGVFLMLAAIASGIAVLLCAMVMIGLLAVIVQTAVAFAANLTSDAERGRVVGRITSGIVIGILLARTVSGTLADLSGWRTVYVVSAALTLIMAFVLLWKLPAYHRTKAAGSYFSLLRSVFVLFATERILLMRGLMAMLIFASGVVLWTPMVFPLSAPPFSFSHTAIGLFGIIGVAGALGAFRAGHLADKGYARYTSGIGLLLILLAWPLIALLYSSLWALIAGIIMLDMGLQAVHVTNQAVILKVKPDARSRITGGYMIFYSIGSGAGSLAATKLYAYAGWTGVCILGASISLLAIGVWLFSLRYEKQAVASPVVIE